MQVGKRRAQERRGCSKQNKERNYYEFSRVITLDCWRRMLRVKTPRRRALNDRLWGLCWGLTAPGPGAICTSTRDIVLSESDCSGSERRASEGAQVRLTQEQTGAEAND